MTASARLPDYLGFGLAAARPATPALSANCLGLYFATDTTAWSAWTGSSWSSVAVGSVTAADHGGVINSGTIQIDNMVTLTGTNAGTTTIAPGSGTTWVVLNMPTAAGTVTVAAAPVFAGQKSILDIKFGATLSTPSLNSGYVMGGGITYTPGTVVNSIDRMEIVSPDGTHWVVQALSQGGTL